MDLGVCLWCFVILISSNAAYHASTVEDYYDYTSDDFIQTKSPDRAKNPTQPPSAKYEVTEKVEDIPNPSPQPVPVATNFTLNKPLNVISPNNTGNSKDNVNRDNPKFRNDFTNIPFDNSKVLFEPNVDDVASDLKPNTDSDNPIGNSKFELEDEDDYFETKKKPCNSEPENDPEFDPNNEDNGSHEGFHHISNILPFIKRYLYGLERGLINGFNSLAGKEVFKGIKVNERSKIPPVLFLNKLKSRRGHAHDDRNLHTRFDYEFDDY